MASANSIWHAEGVPSAVAKVRASNSLLVVLTTYAGAAADDNGTLAAASSHALEHVTFASPMARAALSLHSAVCIRLRGAASDPDFTNFRALFAVPHTPFLHIVAPDGRVLLARPYFTSPLALVRALDYAARVRDAPNGAPPTEPVELGPELHPRRALPARRAPRPRATATAKPAAKPAAAEKPAAKPTAATKPAAAKPAAARPRAERPAAAGTDNRVSPDDTEMRELPNTRSALQLGSRARLQLRLPSGETATRSFSADTALRDVAVWASEAMGGDPVRLSTSFPRRTFDAADDEKTLQELALVPSATLIATRAPVAARGAVSASGSMLRDAVGSIFGAFVGGSADGGEAPPRGDGKDPAERRG